ncbi:MAG: sigma-70 family RNA polymerase sigma factor [archaeon]|nr:sigma-70 family RNA polymerase sigma factor [archaeon]
MDSVDEITRQYYKETGKVIKQDGLPMLNRESEIALSKSIDEYYRRLFSAALEYYKKDNEAAPNNENLRKRFSRLLGKKKQQGLEKRLSEESIEKVALDYFHPDNKTEVDRQKIEELATEIYAQIETEVDDNSETRNLKAEEFIQIYRSCSRRISRKKEEFALRNLRLVWKYAIQYAILMQEENLDEVGRKSNTFFESDDFFGEGYFGLLRAIDKFDHRKGFKFSTYPTWWIKQSIQKHIQDNCDTIRKPSNVIEKYNAFCAAKSNLERINEEEPSYQDIAEEYTRRKILIILKDKGFLFETESPKLEEILSTVENLEEREIKITFTLAGSRRPYSFSSKEIRPFIDGQIKAITTQVPDLFDLMNQTVNLEKPVRMHNGEDGSTIGDFIPDPKAEIEFDRYDAIILHQRLNQMMDEYLTEREKFVLSYRIGIVRGKRKTVVKGGVEKPDNELETTLGDLAEILNLSKQRIDQIQRKAIQKLREVAPELRAVFEAYINDDNVFLEETSN